jgi:CubicO group peptidase (beta-lactamase class C family)
LKPILAVVLTLLCLVSVTVYAAPSTRPSSRPATRLVKDVSALLAPVIAKNDVPGMAAAVVRDGEIVAVGAAGVRTLSG